MTAIGSSASPSARACARPSERNAVEQIVTAALPRFAISTLSWTLHDAQDPQSPEPAITTSQASESSAMTWDVAAIEAEGFLRFTTRATP